jgi:hypothetical protein
MDAQNSDDLKKLWTEEFEKFRREIKANAEGSDPDKLKAYRHKLLCEELDNAREQLRKLGIFESWVPGML